MRAQTSDLVFGMVGVILALSLIGYSSTLHAEAAHGDGAAGPIFTRVEVAFFPEGPLQLGESVNIVGRAVEADTLSFIKDSSLDFYINDELVFTGAADLEGIVVFRFTPEETGTYKVELKYGAFGRDDIDIYSAGKSKVLELVVENVNVQVASQVALGISPSIILAAGVITIGVVASGVIYILKRPGSKK
ncbi:MAG: hypothetical protein O6762_01890 [Thaumarchaeota archaeon]|nr:hypothetical protein [Nitrososphaerota archaeon]